MTGIVDRILGENVLNTHKTNSANLVPRAFPSKGEKPWGRGCNSAKQAAQRDNATEQMTKLRRFTPR